ncbi:hypothetical protein Tco_0375129 [Tanacetum coccineum]
MCRRQGYMIRRMEKKYVTDRMFWKVHGRQAEVPTLVSKEYANQAPSIIEEHFKNYVSNNVIQVHPTTSLSTSTKSSVDLQKQLYLKIKSNLQDQAADPVL